VLHSDDDVGIRTLSNGVTMSISVYDAAGALVRTTTRSLRPNSFSQFAATDLLGGAIAANQAVVFSIEAGSGVVYGSSVANSGGGSTLQVANAGALGALIKGRLGTVGPRYIS